jgi:peptide/nickel transport system substrate-binding protein
VKRYVVLMLAALFVIFSAIPASAARPANLYPVTFNGHPIVFDVQPEVVDPGVTMVPFRAIFEKMGATVNYDDATSTVTAQRGDTTVKLTIGTKTALVNGQFKDMRVAPFIKDDRTLVELRFISGAFGADVQFDAATTAIAIVDNSWPKRGGTLNLGLWNKPEGPLNPITNNDTYGSYIMSMMYDGLWRYDDRYVPVPALAESWQWTDNDTTLTFNLRKGVKFFDGTELTADDVVFTFKGIAHPKYIGPRNAGYDDVLGWTDYHAGTKGESAANFANGFVTTDGISGLYAADRYTVVFKMTKPNAAFFLGNTPYGIVDHTKYAHIPIQDWGTAKDPNNTNPNGTGAFKMEEYKEGEAAILRANDNYWSGRPYVDRVIFRIIATDVTVGEMKNNTLDMAEISADVLPSYQEMTNVTVNEFPDMVFQTMGINSLKGPTSELAVRQAMSYGIDRMGIIHNLMKDHAGTMYGPVHPLTWAYTDDIPHYDYNPDKAKQLLDDAGWKVGSGGIREKNGQKLHLTLTYPNVGNKVRIATAPYLQQLMKDIGIEVELLGYDWPTITTKVFEDQDFNLYFIGWSLGNSDPDPTGLWDKASTVSGGNYPAGWTDALSEELIAKGKTTNDIDERMAIYQEWAKHFMENAPAYYFYAANTMLARNNRLQNFRPGPWGYYWNIEEMWLSN